MAGPGKQENHLQVSAMIAEHGTEGGVSREELASKLRDLSIDRNRLVGDHAVFERFSLPASRVS
jgi:hypothetical protein